MNDTMAIMQAVGELAEKVAVLKAEVKAWRDRERLDNDDGASASSKHEAWEDVKFARYQTDALFKEGL